MIAENKENCLTLLNALEGNLSGLLREDRTEKQLIKTIREVIKIIKSDNTNANAYVRKLKGKDVLTVLWGKFLFDMPLSKEDLKRLGVE